MNSLYAALTEAADEVKHTLKPGDVDKWEHYVNLSGEGARLKWRLDHGHVEFCRLQRLSFHCYI